MFDNVPRRRKDSFARFWDKLRVRDYGVYRLYDEEGKLLYVGMTRTLRQRISTHYWDTKWGFNDIHKLEFDYGYSEEEARWEEARQIAALEPIHNKVQPPIGTRPAEGVDYWIDENEAEPTIWQIDEVKTLKDRVEALTDAGLRLHEQLTDCRVELAEKSAERRSWLRRFFGL